MRPLLLLLVALVIGCGDDTTTAPLEDMAPYPHDCAHIVLCDCLDGTCQRTSGCSAASCDNACVSHDGVGGSACANDDAGL